MMRRTNYVYFHESFVCCQLCCFFLWWIYAVTSLVVCFVALLRLFLNPWHTWRSVRRCKILRSDMFPGLTFWSPLTLLVVALTLQMWSSFCSCILQKKLCSIFIGLAELDVLGRVALASHFTMRRRGNWFNEFGLWRTTTSPCSHCPALWTFTMPPSADCWIRFSVPWATLFKAAQTIYDIWHIYIYITWHQWYHIRYICYCCDLLWFDRPVNSWAGSLMRSARILSCFDIIWCEAFSQRNMNKSWKKLRSSSKNKVLKLSQLPWPFWTVGMQTCNELCVTAHLFSVEERATFAFWRMILTIALPAQRAKPGASLLGCTMMIHDCTSWIVLIDIDCTYGIDALATPWRKDM